MSKPSRRLGRGLDSLVSDLRPAGIDQGDDPLASSLSDRPDKTKQTSSFLKSPTLETDSLVPNPFQPRSIIHDDTLISLAASIKKSGLLQPIAVRRVSGRYEIIAGERRWRAARSIGLKRVPVILREANDEQMLELALIENLQREDLNAIDRAKAYRRFCDRFQLKPEDVAGRLGEDRTTVVNYLRLLELPASIQDRVEAGELSMGHARCLLGITDDAHRDALARSATENDLSVRALEEIVRREKTRADSPALSIVERVRPEAAHIRDLQRRYEDALKTKVVIQQGKRKGSGRIIIEYYSLDDFDRISAVLGVPPE